MCVTEDFFLLLYEDFCASLSEIDLWFFKIILFIYFWLNWVFAAAHRLSLVAMSGVYSLVVGHVLLFAVASRAQTLACKGFSSCGPQALEHRLNSCGAQAWLLCGMWDLPGPGIEPCLLPWQADSLPLSHQGNPWSMILWVCYTWFM